MFVYSLNIHARMSSAQVWSFYIYYVTYLLASEHKEGLTEGRLLGEAAIMSPDRKRNQDPHTDKVVLTFGTGEMMESDSMN